jgi:hypothetical protein
MHKVSFFLATPYMVTLKVVSVYVTKTFKGRRNIGPHVLNLGNIWRPVVKFTLGPSYPQKGTPVSIQYPLNCGVCGLQRRSWRFGEKKIYLSLQGFKPQKV